MTDPTRYYVQFDRARHAANCSLCATPIRLGVRAALRYPGRNTDTLPHLYLCDDCADAIGALAFTPDEPPIYVSVGGVCCTVPVEG